MSASGTEAAARTGGSERYILFVTVAAALGGALYGYDTAVISGAVIYLEQDFGLGTAGVGWAITSALLGASAGAAFSARFSDAFGRKKVLILAGLFFIVSGLGSALAQSLTELIIWRAVGGLGVGIVSAVSPLYIAEIAPAERRGQMVSTFQLALVSSVLIVYFVNYLIASLGSSGWDVTDGWRWMFASQLIPAVVMLGMVFVVPESPRWLVRHGRTDEARTILVRLFGAGAADQQLSSIVDIVRKTADAGHKAFSGKLGRLVLIGIILAIFQQATGINILIYYAPQIFQRMTDATTDVALLETVIIGAVNLIFTLIAFFTVDRLGRKVLILIGFGGMGASAAIIGLAVYFGHVEAYLAVFVVAYVASFAIAIGPVIWVVLSEMFPTSIRGFAMGLALTFNWLANVAVSATFSWMDGNAWLLRHFNHAFPFFVYAVMGGLAMLFVLRFIPETRGRSLEEIESAI